MTGWDIGRECEVQRVTAKEYLEKITHNERIIQNKQIERKYWLDMATSTTANTDGIRVQSSGSGHAMENQIIEVAMIDSEVDKLKKEIADIIKTIQKLSTEEYDFLHKVYVQHCTLKEVQAITGMSYSWVTTTHGRALKNLQKLLDEKKAGD